MRTTRTRVMIAKTPITAYRTHRRLLAIIQGHATIRLRLNAQGKSRKTITCDSGHLEVVLWA